MNESSVLSPADGRVCEIEPGAFRKIAIFLSLWDDHVNRSPIAGCVEQIAYTPGRFLPAFLGNAGRRNENNRITIRGAQFEVSVRQIAGMVARRIVCDCREGDQLAQGQRLGKIRFGSRVELYVPEWMELTVRIGQRVRAGETVVAVIRGEKWTPGS